MTPPTIAPAGPKPHAAPIRAKISDVRMIFSPLAASFREASETSSLNAILARLMLTPRIRPITPPARPPNCAPMITPSRIFRRSKKPFVEEPMPFSSSLKLMAISEMVTPNKSPSTAPLSPPNVAPRMANRIAVITVLKVSSAVHLLTLSSVKRTATMPMLAPSRSPMKPPASPPNIAPSTAPMMPDRTSIAIFFACPGFFSLSIHVTLIMPIATPSSKPITPPVKPPNAAPITAPRMPESMTTHASLLLRIFPLSHSNFSSRILITISSAKSCSAFARFASHFGSVDVRESNSAAMPEDAPPPPPEALFAVSLLISSKPAMLFSALAAAAPTPSSAFFSSFRFFAASFDAEKLVPVRMEINSATIDTTLVKASTSAVNAGSTTLKIGCASVKSAPLSRETAPAAASFC